MSLSELGAYLQRHREEQDLSLDDVEHITRIRRRYLQAIEAGGWDELPPGVYTRGLLRNYARALGLSQDRVLRMYVKERPGEARLPEPQLISQPLIEQPRFNLELILAVVLMVAAVGLFGWIITTQLPGMLPQLAGAGGTPASAEVPALDARQTADPGGQATPNDAAGEEGADGDSTDEPGAAAADENDDRSGRDAATEAAGERDETTPDSGTDRDDAGDAPEDDGDEPSSEAEAGTARSTTAPRRSTTVAPLPTRTRRATPVPDSGLIMIVAATSDTWLRVRTDGEEAYADFLLQGESMTWQAEEVLSLRTGNAGGTEITINGQRIAKLGDMGGVEEREWRLLPNGDIEQREL